MCLSSCLFPDPEVRHLPDGGCGTGVFVNSLIQRKKQVMKLLKSAPVKTAAAILATAALAGCGTTTPTREVSNAYAIYDIKAGAEVGAGRIAEAIKVAVKKNMSEAQVTNGIPPSPLPEKAARFQVNSPFKGTQYAALAAAAGSRLQVPSCEGDILTVWAADSSMSRYGEGTSFFVCLMPYQGGYSMNIYSTFTKASGGFNTAVLAATLARAVVGDSSQFIPRTIQEIVQSVQGTGASVKLVESYP